MIWLVLIVLGWVGICGYLAYRDSKIPAQQTFKKKVPEGDGRYQAVGDYQTSPHFFLDDYSSNGNDTCYSDSGDSSSYSGDYSDS